MSFFDDLAHGTVKEFEKYVVHLGETLQRRLLWVVLRAVLLGLGITFLGVGIVLLGATYIGVDLMLILSGVVFLFFFLLSK